MHPTAQQNALDVLRHDHRKIKDLFETIEESVDLTEQKDAVDSLIQDLRGHLQLEEKIFYPAVKDAFQVEPLVDQSQEELLDIETVIKDLEEMEPEDPLFSDKLMELEDKVAHHIQESETEIFPRVEDSSIDLDQMAESLVSLKHQQSLTMPPRSRERMSRSRRRVAGSKKS
jgi:hemerythrin superfamily protein